MSNEQFEVGEMVSARFNKRAKWKEARIWQIDNSRGLPYGIEELETNDAHGQKGLWLHTFRTKVDNLQKLH